MEHDPMISALIRILKEETRLYASLQAAVKDEHTALVRLSTRELTAAGMEKARIAAAARQLGDQRTALMVRIAERLGLSAGARISELAARLPPEARDALVACRRDMVAVVTPLQRENQRNAKLLTSALAFVRGAVRIFDGLLNPQAVYRRTGRMDYARPRGKMISGNV